MPDTHGNRIEEALVIFWDAESYSKQNEYVSIDIAEEKQALSLFRVAAGLSARQRDERRDRELHNHTGCRHSSSTEPGDAGYWYRRRYNFKPTHRGLEKRSRRYLQRR